jgi:hypothetical protein
LSIQPFTVVFASRMLESMRIRVFVGAGPTAGELVDCGFVGGGNVTLPRPCERPPGQRRIDTSRRGDAATGRRPTQPCSAPVARSVGHDPDG